MRNTILLLVLAAIAATSCSLQVDSQYGMRWEQRRPEQRHGKTESKPMDALAATSPMAAEISASSSATELPQNLEFNIQPFSAHPTRAYKDEGLIPQFAKKHSMAQVGAQKEENHRLLFCDANHAKANKQGFVRKNVWMNLAGALLIVLGAGFLFLSVIGIAIISAYGADIVVLLFLLLFVAIGVALVYLGYKLKRRNM